MIVIGIDPGAQTGIGMFEDGKLVLLRTLDAVQFLLWLESLRTSPRDRMIVLEDSTLTSHVFTAFGLSPAAARKVARNVGEIDAYCKQIKAVCGLANLPYQSVSPRGKGEKVGAKAFKELTGWPHRTNPHERDAAMVAWQFRNWGVHTAEKGAN
jgi:hypothetical protein